MLRPILIKHYLEVMAQKGFSAETVLANTNIEPSRIGDPKLLISFLEYQRIIENMIALAGDHGLGLDIGLQSEITKFGVLGYATLSCATVRQVIEQLRKPFSEPLGILTTFGIAENKNAKSLTLNIIESSPTIPVRRFCIEEALCVFLKIGGQITGTAPPFERLYFAYPRPDYVERYKQIFNCPLHFDAEHNQALMKREWLDAPLPTKDDELNDLYQQHLLKTLRTIASSDSVGGRVRDLLLRNCQRMPSLAEAAAELGLTPRTLSRQLQREGISYQKLIEQLRVDLSQEYLRSGSMATKEISYRLGFDDVNAFRRAFKHWTGKTVMQFRDERAGSAEDAHAEEDDVL